MAALVIVESPAKARTLSRILGSGFVVEASYGHIRDLPEKAGDIPARVKGESWARLGVNVEDDFEPIYVIPKGKKKQVKLLKEAIRNADTLILATDEDREGESISWHVVQVLKPKVPVQRIAFHEITKSAILKALENPRDIDTGLVRAQESRRILDRLFGYLLSPLLWRKVRTGLSAGRVQSVAVRLCVIRERERRRFRSASYWDAEAELDKDGSRFSAKMIRVGDARLAGGQDFDAATGELRDASEARWLRTADEMNALIARLESPWTVVSVEEKPIVQRPAPPFTTSSLQQEANRKLGFSARHTMRIAQQLYEGIDLEGDRVGVITYMRTDSVTLSEKALEDAQGAIKDLYGDSYSVGPRRYKTKSANAQEAHEAIRPTEISRTPESLKKVLDRDALRLYELIWKRMIASQMTDANVIRTAVEIEAPLDGQDEKAVFVARGKQIRFPGYLRAYVEGSDDPNAELADQEVTLPALEVGQSCEPVSIEPKSHETTPPARYTEASLVKKLEAEGIGRPSTYATIIETIQARGYINKQKNALVPTFTAMAVTQLLETHFEHYVDTRFTAEMEEHLDEIARGDMHWRDHLNHFYHGGSDDDPGLEQRIAAEEPQIDYPAVEIGRHPESGDPVVVKVGRYGPYVQVGVANGNGGDQPRAALPEETVPAELTLEEALTLIEKKRKGPRVVGNHPETGLPIYATHGRYGAYVQLGDTPTDKKTPKPKRAKLTPDLHEETVTLEDALRLLSLPRTLGVHPESGDEIIATRGPYGPYVKCGSESRSLGDEHDVFTIGLEQALEVLAQPRQRRGARRQPKVLKKFGKGSGSSGEIELRDGPYGPYLTNGALNASMPKGVSADDLNLEQALSILERDGKPPRRKKRKKKKS